MSFSLPSRGAALLALALGFAAPALAVAAPAAPASPYAASDWKQLSPDNLMVIDTSKGQVIVELIPQLSAEHTDRIKQLVRQGYYDGLQFFRVIDDFMAQTGDKTNTGAGTTDLPSLKGAFTFRRAPSDGFAGVSNGHGATVGFIGSEAVFSQPDELAGLTADGKVRAYGLFCPGTAGMARTGDPDSAAAQFFLMRQKFPMLDTQYTPWGRVVVGLQVVRAITVGEPPVSPDTMIKVRMASDIPAAERPNVWRIDTAGAAFKAQLKAAMAARGDDFTPCDIDVPGEVRK